MAIENLGKPFLGPSSIPEKERCAWPTERFQAPTKVEFIAAEAVINEVYFRRSTALARAKELLGSEVIYMAYHLGVTPDPVNFSVEGAGIVVADEDPSTDDAGRGFYHDACNGQLIVEHTRDPNAKLNITSKGKLTVLDTVGHFHVARYGVDVGEDAYAHLDTDKLYRDHFEETEAGIAGQDLGLKAFGTGIRQYLPTYFHSAKSTSELKGFGTSPALKTFSGLRVPHGLPSRRSYDFAVGLPKHHIYYLNFPGSYYQFDDAAWR
jgi:hypothetical protein